MAAAADVLGLVVSLNVKRRNLKASQKAIGAAEAWGYAEQEGRTLKDGETARRSSSPKVGKDDVIADARDHFAKLFGVSKNYVQQARAVLGDDPKVVEPTSSFIVGGSPSFRERG